MFGGHKNIGCGDVAIGGSERITSSFRLAELVAHRVGFVRGFLVDRRNEASLKWDQCSFPKIKCVIFVAGESLTQSTWRRAGGRLPSVNKWYWELGRKAPCNLASSQITCSTHSAAAAVLGLNSQDAYYWCLTSSPPAWLRVSAFMCFSKTSFARIFQGLKSVW